MSQNDDQNQREELAGPGDQSGLVGQPLSPSTEGLAGGNEGTDASGLLGEPRSPNESGLVGQPTSPDRTGVAGSGDVTDDLGLLGGRPRAMSTDEGQ